MSAFYVGTESLSMLTDIIERYLVAGFDSFGFEFPCEIESLFHGANRDTIFAALVTDNLDALQQRYGIKTAVEMYDGKDYEEGHDIWEPRKNSVQPWHYQLLKSCECYVYQCGEGKVLNSPVYKAMQKLSANITNFIVHNLPAYKEAEWK